MARENGLDRVPSHYSVEETLRRLVGAFAAKGLQVFAVVDHSGEARESWPEDEADEGCDLWESEGGNSTDGGGSEPGD